MWQVTWRSVRHHPLRFVLSLIAVFLGSAYVAGTFTLNGMLTYTFQGIVATQLDADVYVMPAGISPREFVLGASTGQVDSNLADYVDPVPGVLQATPYFTVGGTAVLGADRTPLSSGYAPTLLIGNSPGPWDDRIIDHLDGRAPSGPDEIGIDNVSAEKGGLKVGDRTTIILPEEHRDVTVSGVYTFKHSFAGAIVLLMAVDEVRQIFFPTGLVSSIWVYAEDGVDPATLIDPIAAALPPDSGAQVVLGQDLRDESFASFQDTLGYINFLILIFALLAVFLGGFLIFNTFMMVVRAQLKEIAILRAVGASARQVFQSVLAQAVIVGLIGSGLGVGGGYGLVLIIRLVMRGMSMDMGPVPASLVGAVVAVVVGVVSSLVAAIFPALRAARIPPVEAMRETPPEPKTMRASRTVVVGVSHVLAGCGLVGAATSTWHPVWWLGLGAVGLLVGGFVAIPLISPGVVTVVGWPFARWLAPAGSLARGNVTNNPRRVAVTTGVLMIVMALVGGLTVIVWSMRAQTLDKVTSEFASDFVVRNLSSGAAGLPVVPTEVISQAEEMAGVDTYLERATPATVEALGVKAEDANLAVVVPDDFFANVMRATVVEGSVSQARGQAVVFKPVADQLHLNVGDDIQILIAPNTPLETEAVLPVGLIVDSALTGLSTGVAVPADWFDATVPDEVQAQFVANVTLFVNVHTGVDKTEVHRQLVDIVKPYYTVTIQQGSDLISAANSQINILLWVMYGMLLLALLIAFLGITNTLVLSVAERTREIGLLRAIGLSRGQLTGMIMVEAVLISLLGAVLGLTVGVVVATFFPPALGAQGFDQLAIPWERLGLMLVGAGVVGVLAALIPAWRATKIPVLDAISYE